MRQRLREPVGERVTHNQALKYMVLALFIYFFVGYSYYQGTIDDGVLISLIECKTRKAYLKSFSEEKLQLTLL